MNYTSIEKLFSSGVDNMEIIMEDEQRYSTYSISGVDWFRFYGTTASTIYVSGSSWVGFGSSSEDLSVNGTGYAGLASLYREEGTLFDYFKFLRIRWKGYTYADWWNNLSYLQEYDIILWDTGDISLHMIHFPEKFNDRTYLLSPTYDYSVSTASPDVTFKKTDSGFEVQNSRIDFPLDQRYLIRDNSTIYSISNGSLLPLGVPTIDSALFLNSGVDPSVNPGFDPSILDGLSNPELLYWRNVTKHMTTFYLRLIPHVPQSVIYSAESIPDGSAIKKIEALSTDDVLFMISFDGGVTWNYHNGDDWAVSENDSDGMNRDTLGSLNETIWGEIITSNTYQIRCVLPSLSSKVDRIAVKYTDQ